MKPIYWYFIFWLSVSFIADYYDYLRAFGFPPYGNHHWRQSDGVSMAMNYYYEDLPFLEPAMHFYGEQPEGKGVSEFVLLYYVNALIWKLVGFQFMSFRILNTLLMFLGLFYLFKLFYFFLKNYFFSLLGTLLIFTSPVLVFYGNNFMVNVPAFSFMIIGWYYLAKYIQKHNFRWLLVSSIAFSLGMMFRITMFVALMPILGAWFLSLSKYKIFSFQVPHFSRFLVLIFVVIIPLLFTWAWYSYALHYNEIHHTRYFLTNIKPIWNSTRIEAVWLNFVEVIVYQLNNRIFVLIQFILPIFFLIFHKKLKKEFLYILCFFLVNILLYFALWYDQFEHHDYYLIEFNFLIILNLILLFKLCLSLNVQKIWLYSLNGFITLLVLVLIFRCSLHQKIKYNYYIVPEKFHAFIPQKIDDHFAWVEYFDKKMYKGLWDITPYLRELGIRRTDTVACFLDNSPNLTLILMDVKGYTTRYIDYNSPKEYIQAFKDKTVQYLVVLYDEWLDEKGLREFVINKRIGEYKNVAIYKL